MTTRVGVSVGPWLQAKANKPYYVFRPTQIGRRALLGAGFMRYDGRYGQITLPWGAPLTFKTDEKVGLCFARRGVFDLPVCEALWRLTDPGELTLDVGAYIGQMTSVLAAAAGPQGRVLAFEPHPETFRLLSTNVQRWTQAGGLAPIELREMGAAAEEGVAQLAMDEDFDWNPMTASIVTDGTASSERMVQVPTRRLDDEVGGRRVGVMKLDVEGFEHDVLLGAERLLGEHRIRDIVFEEFDEYPTRVTDLLEGHGYTIFTLDQRLHGPLAARACGSWARQSTEDPNYLATTDPERAVARLAKLGWGVLGVGSFRSSRRPSVTCAAA